MLLYTKNSGIESWFDHSWGIWHRDYAGCVHVFVDIIELMLPTLQPDVSITGNKEKLKSYINSEAFKHFFSHTITDCYGKINQRKTKRSSRNQKRNSRS